MKGGIEVDIFHGGEQRCFALIWPTTMNENENGVFVARIANHVFKIQDIALAETEIVADTDGGMEMHWQFKFAGLIDQNAENVVLKQAVIFGGRNAAGMVLGINGVGLFARRIGEIKRAKVSGFKLDGNAAAFLIVGHGAADKIFIAGEVGGK